MNNTQIATYNEGFYFKFQQNISKADYVYICKLISIKLNELYNTLEEYKVAPEAITEGGIKFISFSNKTNKMYKTLRIHIDNQKFYYPFIDEKTVINSWLNDNDILITANMKGHTFLKAFDGAPSWTLEELNIFKNVFKTFGAICNKMPKKL